MDILEKFKKRIESIPDAYNDFVFAVMTYVNKKDSRLKAVTEYLDKNHDIFSSDVFEFISNQKDFY